MNDMQADSPQQSLSAAAEPASLNAGQQNSRARKTWSRPVLQTYGAITALTQSNGGSKTGDVGSMMTASDINLKQNIVRIGTHPLGIGVYLFDYKPAFRAGCGEGRRFGVMAQEVELVLPAAVSIGDNGYKQVHYALLGIESTLH